MINKGTDNSLLLNFIFAFFFALLIAILSLRLKFLTISGIIATSILAVIVFGLGTWKWTIPIFTFFLLSSLLSKYRSRRNAGVDTFFDKSSQRDYLQVLANGGISGVLVILNYFYNSELFYAAYVSCIASVCADTWATEIGTLAKFRTFNILNFSRIEQGVSGGISIPGLLGALAGALMIAVSSLYWVVNDSIVFILLILLAGFSACILDSILGASLQIQYKCPVCLRTTEKKIHCNTLSEKTRGLSWVNNDIINAVSAVYGAIAGFILTDIILY